MKKFEELSDANAAWPDRMITLTEAYKKLEEKGIVGTAGSIKTDL